MFFCERMETDDAALDAMAAVYELTPLKNVCLRHWETIRPDNILFILRQPEVTNAQSLQFYIVRHNGIHQGTMSLAELPTPVTLSR